MPLSIGSLLPSLDGATDWLNGSFALEDSHMSFMLIQFWAISCSVCKVNMSLLQRLECAYAEVGLHVVSVHIPRMEADMDTGKVRDAMTEMNLTGPCAIDNTHAIGDRFQTGGVWPCYFLFDAQGKLRSRAAGALGLKMAENSLKRMLGMDEVSPTGVTA